ncbi:MAG: hypothetical protein U0230_28345 [Polyangiales bacterium]
MYKVILVPASCGQSMLDVGAIEQNANAMFGQGYELIHVYQTITPGCFGAKTAAVMVFRAMRR